MGSLYRSAHELVLLFKVGRGRQGCGIEIDPTYCDLIVRRLEAQSKHRATLVCGGRTFDEIAAERSLHAGQEVAA